MRISKNLPQFENKREILAVAGTKTGKIFLASNGNVEYLKSVEIENPHYTDKENFVKQGGKGVTAVTGSLKETLKQYTQQKFEKKFLEEIRALAQAKSVTGLVLYVPKEIAKAVKKLMPAELKKLVDTTAFGNYLHSHPFELLAKLKEQGFESKPQPLMGALTRTARNILNRNIPST